MNMVRIPKVLILLPVFNFGGAEKQGLYIARSLQNSGQYRVEVWALEKGTGELCEPLQSWQLHALDLNIPTKKFHNNLQRMSVYWNFMKKLRREKIDYIIPFTYYCNLLATTTYKFGGVKKCFWFQIAMEHHINLGFWEKLAIKFRPQYAANSRSAADFIRQRHGLSTQEVPFVPNPFEYKEAQLNRIQYREKLAVQNDEKMLFMAANFFPEKDHETLIRGFYQAHKALPELKLVLAGACYQVRTAESIKSLCFDLGFHAEQVVFVGTSADVPGLIAASDLCLLTSVSEGSPNALIEYMGYQKPIVASSIPPIVELLSENYPFLFQPGNPEDLCAKIIMACQDLSDENVRHWVAKNYSTVAQEYTIETNYQAFHQLLSS